MVGTSGIATGGYPHGSRTAPNSPINPATDDLGALERGCSSFPSAINTSGQVVGHGKVTGFGGGRCFGDGNEQAFRTAPNSPINPATDNLRAFGEAAYASDINDSGQVVGGIDTVLYFRAFRIAPNRVFNRATDDLGTLGLGGGLYSNAFGINNLGQVVGESGHAFRTAPNSPINPVTDDLGTLGGLYSSAHGINNLGQVVGLSNIANGPLLIYHAFRTAPNSPINPATDDLGTLGGSSSYASGINNLGQGSAIVLLPPVRLTLSCIAAVLCTTLTT